MKKLLVFTISLLCFVNIFAQLNPQGLANAELRAIFEHLNLPPSNTKHFLYDMSSHVVDEVFFSNYCLEQNNTDNWFMLYEEMYEAAYDRTLWDKAEDIFDNVYNNPNGEIPIGIMDFDYYRLKNDALTTNNYFDFDLSNNTISDKPGRPNDPYDTYNIFSAAPLVQSSSLSKVTFSIGPHIYLDQYNSQYYDSPYQLGINFDDGNGWIMFNSPQNEVYIADYTVIGDKEIEVAIFDDGGKIIKYSKSLFVVGNTHSSPTPDMVITSVPGLKADAYFNCTNTTQQLQKVLIYVEGYEILDFLKVFPAYKSQSMAEDYAEMIEQPQLIQLQNFGYDIVMVDFGSTGNSIHDNAMSLIGLIEFLKCQTMNDHQFVILGHSMGGVISKYALSYMEEYPPSIQTSCNAQKNHNTRLLITNDSPHQGANIPLSLQHLYRIGFDALPGQSALKRKIAEKFNVMLDSKGVKEMLIYHVDTRNSSGHYTHHSRRTTFLNNLSNLANNGYPRNCKLMALSNGSMGGKAQTKLSGDFRSPNDTLLDMSASVYLRILGIKILGTDAAFVLRTNPHLVTGDLLKASVDAWKIKVQFFWFGVTLNKTKYSLYNHNITASNIISYGTSAGGIYKFDLIKRDPYSKNFSLPPLGSFKSSSSGTGNLDFELSIGTPWLANANANFSIKSDGLYWNFVPVNSALDYDLIQNGSIDIESTYNSASTQFDVISGIPTSWVGPSNGALFNRHHRFVRNEALNIHPSCPQFTNGKPNYVRLLNQEIGENILFLDNMDLNRTGMYEAQYDILVNYPNPGYTYPTSGGGLFSSVYSNNGCFKITGAGIGNCTFKYDAVNSLNTPPGLRYNNTISCPAPTSIPLPYNTLDIPQLICCIDYAEERESIEPIEVTKNQQSLAITLFPNPARLGEFTVEMDWARGNKADIQMMDLLGNILFTKSLTDLSPGETIRVRMNTPTNSLPSGMYFISVSDGKEKVAEKIMILN